MIVDKIIVTIMAITTLIYLGIKLVNNNKKKNIMIMFVQAFFLGIYLTNFLTGKSTYLIYDIISAIFMIFIPTFFATIQYHNIHINEKMLIFRLNLKYASKKYDDAVIIGNKLLNKNIVNSRVLYILGRSYQYRGENIKSRDSFLRAVEINKKDYKSYFQLAKILHEKNKLETAEIMYNNCLRIKPDFFDASEALSMIHCYFKNYDKAIEVYKDALRYHPNSVEAYYNLAVIYEELRDLEKSKEYFKKASENRPKLYGAHYNIGQIYYLQGDYDKAIEYFKKARSSTMYGIKAYYYLAKVYMARNEREKAISHLEYAMELDPSYISEAKNEMIFTCIRDFIENYIETKVKPVKNVYDVKYSIEKARQMSKQIEEDIRQEEREELVKAN